MDKEKCIAIVLAAGQGKRMGTKIQKQYLELQGYPVIYHTMHVFETSDLIDEIVMVVSPGQVAYAKQEIVDQYGFRKVRHIVEGGKERYHSVWNALQVIHARREKNECFVFVHDGARPFVDHEMLERVYQETKVHKACVLGMPSKDTIKIVDQAHVAQHTPDREYVWLIQTPQVFAESILYEAYEKLMRQEEAGNPAKVTDDAMVMEKMSGYKVKLVEGSYQNIKLTTPEDLDIAKLFLTEKNKKIQE